MIQVVLGVFDSGLGGLTILGEIHRVLPELDTLYLGDNARAPYGDDDRDTIHRHAWEGVRFLLDAGCPLVIVACNTAAAQALRRIQRENLPRHASDRRVLGVIRPSAEIIAGMMHGGHIGVIGTAATVAAGAYTREFEKTPRPLRVTEVAAPDIALLVESGMTDESILEDAVRGALSELLARDPAVDTVLLGCTHFPWILPVFRRVFPPRIALVTQGPLVAEKLSDYLRRHPEISARLSRQKQRRYLTTGDPTEISTLASTLMKTNVRFELARLVQAAPVTSQVLTQASDAAAASH
ncbi:MAG: glutamate racemase [Gammaproteobacteria bacterium]